MKLSDYTTQRAAPSQPKAAGELSGLRLEVRNALYEEIPAHRIAQLVAEGRSTARRELAATVDQIVRSKTAGDISQAELEQVVGEVLDLILGLGPIERLLNDADVTEVMVNGPAKVFYERDGIIHSSHERFENEEQLRLVVDRIVSPLGRRCDEQSPIVNARLPEGHRVNVVIPPVSMSGTAVTIRKFRERIFTLEELTDMGSMSRDIATLLEWAVKGRKNIAVSGGTGGGKTTLLNALSAKIPHDERIITIEDSAELRFDTHPHVVRLEAREENAEGKGLVSIRDLVVNSLRMRPDRIVVGECRGAEAADMLQAMNTGHDGSLTTLHANSPDEVMLRLVMMVRYGMELPTEVIEAQIRSALDLVVQQDRMPDGSRKVTQVAMRPVAGSACARAFMPVVEWERQTKAYVWHAAPPWVDLLPYLGVASKEEVDSWLSSVHLPC